MPRDFVYEPVRAREPMHGYVHGFYGPVSVRVCGVFSVSMTQRPLTSGQISVAKLQRPNYKTELR